MSGRTFDLTISERSVRINYKSFHNFLLTRRRICIPSLAFFFFLFFLLKFLGFCIPRFTGSKYPKGYSQKMPKKRKKETNGKENKEEKIIGERMIVPLKIIFESNLVEWFNIYE